MTQGPIDWRAVVDEAIRRRKEEGLSQRALAALAGVSVPTVNAFEQGEIRLRFERVVAILDALGLFIQPGPPDSLNAFIHGARRRWEELVRELPHDHPSRQPLGHSEQAYAIEGVDQPPPLSKLRDTLAQAPRTSGWTPFWVPSRDGLKPIVRDGVVECWLGRPDVDRHFNDAAHSDFWQVSREGQAYLQRGYQEDGHDLEPGTIFDVTLPIWRTGEVLLHAAWLARELGAPDETNIRFVARYTGLAGRELIAWAKPLLRHIVDDRRRARSPQADLATAATLHEIEDNLETVVGDVVGPLYERFDGYELPVELVAEQLSELRRNIASTAGGRR
jgi:transcriptional regulator with XRE-family HTH domain